KRAWALADEAGDGCNEGIDLLLWGRVAEAAGACARPSGLRPRCRLRRVHSVACMRQRPDAGDRLILISIQHQNIHGCTGVPVSARALPGLPARMTLFNTSVK